MYHRDKSYYRNSSTQCQPFSNESSSTTLTINLCLFSIQSTCYTVGDLKESERTVLKDNENKKRNVIPIPRLQERYIALGKERLKEQEFEEAVDLYEQAIEMDSCHEEVYFSLLACYMELHHSQKGVALCEEMMKLGLGHYFTVMELYVTFLIQERKYDKAYDVLRMLFEEEGDQIPAEQYNRLQRVLQLCDRVRHEGEFIEEIVEDVLLPQQEEWTDWSRLFHENIRPELPRIKRYLASEDTHPFTKTLMLHALKEQEVNASVTVCKFGETFTGSAMSLPTAQDWAFKEEVLTLLASVVEDEDPTLYTSIQALVERHFFLLYPFTTPTSNASKWAYAYMIQASEWLGQEEQVQDWKKRCPIPYDHLEPVFERIQSLEEMQPPHL